MTDLRAVAQRTDQVVADARAELVRAVLREVRRLVSEAGGSNLRVFGSVAAGTDTEKSDIDLLSTIGPPLSLMELNALNARVGEVLGVSVDLIPDTAISPALRERILAEAIPL